MNHFLIKIQGFDSVDGTMENICKRFPHLANRIFDQVDDQSLHFCKQVSGEVLEYLDKEKFFWIRIIKKYQRRLKDFPKLWKPVIEKTPVEIVKQIAIAVSQFFQLQHLYSDFCQAIYTQRRLRQWSLISISANHGDLAILQYIVNKIKLKNVRKTEKNNALLLAAYKGHFEIYQFLSARLKDKNPGYRSLLNKWGRTPLHWAAHQGHLGLCKYIIENTSNKNPVSINGTPFSPRNYSRQNTPLHLAAENGHLEVCKFIMDNIPNKDPTIWNKSVFTLSRNSTGTITRCEQETPLHLAAKSGQIAVCRLMLGNMLDKNPASNLSKTTPLHYAAEAGHLQVCKLIMENIIDKNPNSEHGRTPLFLAQLNGHSEVCQLFYENGSSSQRLGLRLQNYRI